MHHLVYLATNIPAGLWLMTEVVQASGIQPRALNAGVVICAVVSEDAGCRLLLFVVTRVPIKRRLVNTRFTFLL